MTRIPSTDQMSSHQSNSEVQAEKIKNELIGISLGHPVLVTYYLTNGDTNTLLYVLVLVGGMCWLPDEWTASGNKVCIQRM